MHQRVAILHEAARGPALLECARCACVLTQHRAIEGRPAVLIFGVQRRAPLRQEGARLRVARTGSCVQKSAAHGAARWLQRRAGIEQQITDNPVVTRERHLPIHRNRALLILDRENEQCRGVAAAGRAMSVHTRSGWIGAPALASYPRTCRPRRHTARGY